MSLGIEVRDLRLQYGDVAALDGLSFSLSGGKIYGLLGRNGSGKTSLLSILAAFRRKTSGTVHIGGQEPFENERVTAEVCLIRESGGDVYDNTRLEQLLRMAADLRPAFDHQYALKLADRFQLPMRKNVQSLSRGQRSALGAVMGLAANARLTMFDESYLGMDAPSRYAFYDELIANYTENPRTFIISTHLIEEVARLFEEVLIIHKGRLVLHDDVEAVRSRGVSVIGPAEVVDTFTAGLTVLNGQSLGRTKAVTVYGTLDDDQRRAAALAGLELGPVSLQDLFVHLTGQPEAEAAR
ncbi:ATP-binding cassette domain-containing protein [Catelliglobosispora koreensis]|uniref:ATP-binding cassette domain-containing protein n=1 Tax=Catelliglobosispora koreensis TaxID=129052 RepID=UPI00037B373C|nr:ABC transporter ATP-binding protein [Catelliglobosispora koreensis]